MTDKQTRRLKRKKRIRRFLLIQLIVLVVLAGGAFLLVRKLMDVSYPKLPANRMPKVGVWYSVYTDDGAASDGSDWHGLYRRGKENRLLIHFFGGGVSLNSEMDEENGKNDGFFYSTTMLQDVVVQLGIFSDDERNPFRDWSFLAIPYATGDFHIGQSICSYVDDEGNAVMVRHQGYENYSGLMEKLEGHLGVPDALVISGSSAGGFATALLTDELMDYFPETKNVTACVDSSILLYDDWRETAEQFWKAPEEICQRLHSNNITLDSLQALREKRGQDVKILFACSVKDRKLQEYQNYIDRGEMAQTEESAADFQVNLQKMADEIEALGDAGVYLFEGLVDPITGNTQHMLLPLEPLEKLVDDTSMAEWMMDAVEGTVRSYRITS